MYRKANQYFTTTYRKATQYTISTYLEATQYFMTIYLAQGLKMFHAEEWGTERGETKWSDTLPHGHEAPPNSLVTTQKLHSDSQCRRVESLRSLKQTAVTTMLLFLIVVTRTMIHDTMCKNMLSCILHSKPISRMLYVCAFWNFECFQEKFLTWQTGRSPEIECSQHNDNHLQTTRAEMTERQQFGSTAETSVFNATELRVQTDKLYAPSHQFYFVSRICIYLTVLKRGSSVGIVTGYGLDDRGVCSESC
jgi:hypothetical protein